MPGLVLGIHDLSRINKTWMAGTTLAAVAARPAMTTAHCAAMPAALASVVADQPRQ
jgi:hypothetical protein